MSGRIAALIPWPALTSRGMSDPAVLTLTTTRTYQPELKAVVGKPAASAVVPIEVSVHPLDSPEFTWSNGDVIKAHVSACVRLNGVMIGYLADADCKRHVEMLRSRLGYPLPIGGSYLDDHSFLASGEAFADDRGDVWRVRITLL